MTNCSSTPQAPPEPPWIHQATRVVDNGYIVYVGTGEDPSLERGQFLAEGKALEDLANECSFAPKGTRIEDHYNAQAKYLFHSYAKVAVEIEECDKAQKATDPESVRQLANQSFTDEIKKYQEAVDEGEGEEVAQNGQPLAAPANPQPYVVHDTVGFFVVRQQIAYEKEVVILSPPAMYQPGAPETVAFTRVVEPATVGVQTYVHSNPEIMKAPTTWSNVPNRPQAYAIKPQSLRSMSPRAMSHPVRPPPHPSAYHGSGNPGKGGGNQKKRRHYPNY